MASAFFFVFALIFVVFFGGIVLLIIFVFRKSTEKKTPQFSTNERREMLDRVKSRLHNVVSWDNKSFRDISHNKKFSYVKGLSITSKGTLYSTQGESLVVFERVERGLYGDGSMIACSTGFSMICAFTNGDITIQFDREPLGRITSGGSIYDPQGNRISQIKRPSRTTTSFGELIAYTTGDSHYPVTFNGRQVATVWLSGTGMSDTLIEIESRASNQGSSSIIRVNDTPTPAEEKWLLALAVLEGCYYNLSVM
jgi:hypothetical protein